MRTFFRKNRTIFIILLIVVVVASAFLFVNRSNADTTGQYQTATITRGKLTATIGATGSVRAKQTAVLIWQAAGTVDTVNVNVGDNIPADFVMAFLEKTSLPQSVIMAEADLVSAQKELDELLNSDTARAQAVVALRDAQDAYDKAQEYYDSLFRPYKYYKIAYKYIYLPGKTKKIPILKKVKVDQADEETIAKEEQNLALAKAQLDDAQREYDRLTAGNTTEIAAAQARVDAAQATLNLARVISPFAGTVTETSSLPGDLVSAGATAFRLDDLTSLLVDVEVSEVDINRVSIGQPVTLSFDAILDKDYSGQVIQVAQAGNNVNGVVNFTVTVELIDADASVKPGMTAGVNIVVEEMGDVVLVPNRAVRLADGKRVVYLLVDDQPVQTEIGLGSSSETMSVISSGDVQEGDIVILNPPAEFGPGGGPGGGFGG